MKLTRKELDLLDGALDAAITDAETYMNTHYFEIDLPTDDEQNAYKDKVEAWSDLRVKISNYGESA